MFFHSKRSDNTKNSSSSMKLDERLKKKILHCFKRRHCEKLCCEWTSQFYICVYIQCSRRRPTDPTASYVSFFQPKLTFSFQSFPSQQASSSWTSLWFFSSLLKNLPNWTTLTGQPSRYGSTTYGKEILENLLNLNFHVLLKLKRINLETSVYI